jgi:hypothetical protein
MWLKPVQYDIYNPRLKSRGNEKKDLPSDDKR